MRGQAEQRVSKRGTPRVPRSPSAVIIGAGLGGLCTAIGLKRAGLHNFVICEKADAVGGTWRDNVYPGAAVDVTSQLYSYSFEPNSSWSRLFPSQAEIFRYIEHCVDAYDLRPHLRVGTDVVTAAWDDDNACWRVKTASGDELVADVLVSAVGLLSIPSLPSIPGLSDFAGASFHSARWDRSLDLRGKNVAVIGTGSSGVQIVSAIAPLVADLNVFQREPHWVLPRGDRPIGRLEQRAYRSAPIALRLARARWFWRLERVTAGGQLREGPKKEAATARALEYLERVIPDAELRERLTPTYPLGCKRVVFSDDYYSTLLRDNVELVAVPISRIDPAGVVTTDGKRRDVDVIVMATGFHATTFLSKVAVTGRGGLTLADAWGDGAEAYLGMTVAGFPNLFMMYGPNSNMRNSILFGHECQTRYIVQAMRRLARRKVHALDLRPEVQRRYNEVLQDDLEHSVWTAGCGNYFRAPSGKVVTQWPHTAFRYWRATRWLRARDFVDVRPTRAAARAAGARPVRCDEPALHPETKEFVERLGPAASFPRSVQFDQTAAERYRNQLRAALPGAPATATAGRTRELATIDLPNGRTATVYSPGGDEPRPGLLYFHGGGWVGGSVESSHGVCRALASATRSVVVSVDYRYAPEHPFPAAFDDCVGATRWLAAHGPTIGVDPARLGVSGSSSGGNLAAAVALWCRDVGRLQLAAQVLIYPALDSRMATPSFRSAPRDLMLDRDQCAWFWSQYVHDPRSMTDPYASPAHCDDLRDLPPAIIVTAEHDPLRDEAEIYASRLMRAGVPVGALRYGGQVHGFVAQLVTSEARAAMRDIGERTRRLLASSEGEEPPWH